MRSLEIQNRTPRVHVHKKTTVRVINFNDFSIIFSAVVNFTCLTIFSQYQIIKVSA